MFTYFFVNQIPRDFWCRFAFDVHIELDRFACFQNNWFQVGSVNSWFHWKREYTGCLSFLKPTEWLGDSLARNYTRAWFLEFWSRDYNSSNISTIRHFPQRNTKHVLTVLVFDQMKLARVTRLRRTSLVDSNDSELELLAFLEVLDSSFTFIRWKFSSRFPVWLESERTSIIRIQQVSRLATIKLLSHKTQVELILA